MAEPLYIWLLEQTAVDDLDSYDSCVVAAATEDDAKLIHPSCYVDRWDDGRSEWIRADGEVSDCGNDQWSSPALVTATKIGFAVGDVKPGDVLCASFNAG